MRLRSFTFWFVVVSTFIAGVALGFFKGSELYSTAHRLGLLSKSKLKPRLQLIHSVFSEDVYEGDFKFKAIHDLSEIRTFPEQNLINTNEFDSAYDRIHILGEELLVYEFRGRSIPVVKIIFEYFGKEFERYAYGKPWQSKIPNKYATLIIPGTGINQSSAIFCADSTNYHYGVLEAIQPLEGDVFVLVKPNEDFLAYHNGKGKKLNQMALINYHLNRRSSYSASYILKGFAFVKWAKNRYDKTALAGLSQGGAATLYISVNAQPNIAIIASGHSVLFNDVNICAPNQLLGVPGYAELFDKEKFRHKLQHTVTNYFFSWGRMEGDYYGIESDERITSSWLKDLKNVQTTIHIGGHEFPVNEIQEFITKRRS